MRESSKQTLTQTEKRLIKKLVEKRIVVQTRYPFLFILLVTFGAVATLQGFSKIIENIDFFADNPWILLTAGLFTLLATGTLYKKLN
jgi:hypothetical protein